MISLHEEEQYVISQCTKGSDLENVSNFYLEKFFKADKIIECFKYEIILENTLINNFALLE